MQAPPPGTSGKLPHIDDTSLLRAIAEAQLAFLEDPENPASFEQILNQLLGATGADMGFIAEAREERGGSRRLITHATNMTACGPAPCALAGLGTEVVLANDAVLDRAATGQILRTRHCPFASPGGGQTCCASEWEDHVTIPFLRNGTLIGLVALGRRSGEFAADLLSNLEALLNTCGALLSGTRERQLRKLAEQQLRHVNAELEACAATRERALQMSEGRLRALFQSAPDTVFILDSEAVIVLANRRAEQQFGYSPGELVGKSPLDLFGGMRGESGSEIDVLQPIPVFGRRRDGSLFPAEVSLALSTSEQGPTILASIRDMTTQLRAEEALRQASRLKDEFLANMSHELRTPLTGILGLSEALQLKVYGALSERQDNAVRLIEQSGQHLLELINAILDLAKIGAGRIELDFAWCDVESLCRAALAAVEPAAREKKQRLSLRCNGDIPELAADPRRLKQMLVNLLSNAVKFTGDGGVISVEVEVDRTNDRVSFHVLDTGIGIDAEYLDRLFHPFSQADSGMTRIHDGSGLGLALVKRLAELHHGDVVAQSTPGVGTRFTLSLPRTQARLAAADPLNPALPPQASR